MGRERHALRILFYLHSKLCISVLIAEDCEGDVLFDLVQLIALITNNLGWKKHLLGSVGLDQSRHDLPIPGIHLP